MKDPLSTQHEEVEGNKKKDDADQRVRRGDRRRFAAVADSRTHLKHLDGETL